MMLASILPECFPTSPSTPALEEAPACPAHLKAAALQLPADVLNCTQLQVAYEEVQGQPDEDTLHRATRRAVLRVRRLAWEAMSLFPDSALSSRQTYVAQRLYACAVSASQLAQSTELRASGSCYYPVTDRMFYLLLRGVRAGWFSEAEREGLVLVMPHFLRCTETTWIVDNTRCSSSSMANKVQGLARDILTELH